MLQMFNYFIIFQENRLQSRFWGGHRSFLLTPLVCSMIRFIYLTNKDKLFLTMDLVQNFKILKGFFFTTKSSSTFLKVFILS